MRPCGRQLNATDANTFAFHRLSEKSKGRIWPFSKVREGPLLSSPTCRSGSGTVKRSAAPNGGTASDPGRSRIGDRCALISGRSVESHQCRRPATTRPTSLPSIFLQSGRIKWSRFSVERRDRMDFPVPGCPTATLCVVGPTSSSPNRLWAASPVSLVGGSNEIHSYPCHAPS